MHAVLFVFKGTANVFAIMKSLLNVHNNTVCVSLDPARMDSLLSIKSVRKCSVWNELMVRPVCLLQHGNLECTQTLHVINFDSHPPDRRCLSHSPHSIQPRSNFTNHSCNQISVSVIQFLSCAHTERCHMHMHKMYGE